MWFDVDKDGLAKLLERRGKSWIIFELVQNAWDEQVSRVDITLTPVEGRPLAVLRVEDDSPEGFRDLRHAYTLFAESGKKGNAEQRGRFNLGEKLVLALCEKAEITSTSGGVLFTAEGRQRRRAARARGTVFEATVRMTRADIADVEAEVRRLIAPVPTYFNGERIGDRRYTAKTQGVLATEIAGDDGVLRRSARTADVYFYDVRPGETGTIYEMGIPVMETGDAFHADVRQKVPLGMERDALPDAFVRDVRALMLNATAELLGRDNASDAWVGDALEDPIVSEEAVRTIAEKRYGENRVSFDPSDSEANRKAVAHGFTVVHGGMLSKAQWENVRRAGALKPAGQVFPTPKPFHPDGKPIELLKPFGEGWTPDHGRFTEFVEWLGWRTIGKEVVTRFSVSRDWNREFNGAFGPDCVLYVANDFFLRTRGDRERALDFLIHEFGHVEGHDHLAAAYHDWLTKIGARAAIATAECPAKLELLDKTAAETCAAAK